MILPKIKQGALVPYYAQTGNSSGYYRILPGYPSYICLNEILLEGSEETHQFIYQTLIDYHNSIPLDSKLRVFELTRYFEELEILQVAELPPIIIGRAMRRWRFSMEGERVRVVGDIISKAG
jgi:hypothetical protein